MTPEEIYDTEIAPKLMAIGLECQKHGLPFVAAVEYAPESIARTTCWGPGEAGFAIRLVDVAAKAHGNVDSLIWALMRYAEKEGHSSVCLHILGVSEKPKLNSSE